MKILSLNGIGDKIAQVFHNLIDNALSFSEKGDYIDINIWRGKNGFNCRN